MNLLLYPIVGKGTYSDHIGLMTVSDDVIYSNTLLYKPKLQSVDFIATDPAMGVVECLWINN